MHTRCYRFPGFALVTVLATLAVSICVYQYPESHVIYQYIQSARTNSASPSLSTRFDNTSIWKNEQDGVKERMKWCGQMDSKILNDKKHFRWENEQMQFVTMANLLQRPNCVFCTLVCKLKATETDTPEASGRKVGYHTPWKQIILVKLSDILQKKFLHLQSPENCFSVRKLACSLYTNKNGLGANVHLVAYCLMMAYIANRTLILKTDDLRYGETKWSDFFMPISTCSLEHRHFTNIKLEKSLEEIFNSTVDVIMIPHYFKWNLTKPDFLSLAIPDNLAFVLTLLIDDPPAWWIGQFVKYIFRLRPEIERNLQREMLSNFHGTVAGIHIRRGDKLRWDARYHSEDQYMSHVSEFFNGLEHGIRPQNIYIATDDASVFENMETKFPFFNFIYNKTIAENAKKRRNSLLGIIKDIYMLSNCDFIVCTLSSNVCRLLYELSLARGRNVTEMFRSIDGMYFLTAANRELYIAEVSRHSSSEMILKSTMEMSVGDTIERVNKKHNYDYYFGQNRCNGKSGTFSITDVKRVWTISKYPAFNI